MYSDHFVCSPSAAFSSNSPRNVLARNCFPAAIRLASCFSASAWEILSDMGLGTRHDSSNNANYFCLLISATFATKHPTSSPSRSAILSTRGPAASKVAGSTEFSPGAIVAMLHLHAPWLHRGLDLLMQHFLYFLPEPQGQGSLRPIFTVVVIGKISDSAARSSKTGGDNSLRANGLLGSASSRSHCCNSGTVVTHQVAGHHQAGFEIVRIRVILQQHGSSGVNGLGRKLIDQGVCQPRSQIEGEFQCQEFQSRRKGRIRMDVSENPR